MKYNHHFTCPIHGSIPVTDEERKYIDHPYFQRLRNIKQLGLAYLVYPNATHSRFAHSLGVMHLAGKLSESILKNSNELTELSPDHSEYCIKVSRLAGLFHDLGHGPLSHFFEHCFEPKTLNELDNNFQLSESWFSNLEEHKKFNNSKLEHEHISLALIKQILPENNTDLAQDISSMLFDEIVPSITFKSHLAAISKCFNSDDEKNIYQLKKVFKTFISGEIDADRLDYLQRDSHFSGVKISSIDIDHIVSSISLRLFISSGKDAPEFYIRISPSAVSSVEQVLISRRQMFNQVYLHRTSFLLGKLLEKIINDKKATLNIWPDIKLESFIHLTDESFISTILKSCKMENLNSNSPVGDICGLLFSRRIPLERVSERYITDTSIQVYQEDIRSKFKNDEFYSITPKEFTKLTREKNYKGENSLISISFHDLNSIIPINHFSEVFESTLWRKNVIKLLIVKNPIQTAINQKLIDEVAISEEIDGTVNEVESNLKEISNKGNEKKQG